MDGIEGDSIATVKVMMCRAWFVGFLLLAAVPLNATDRLALKVSPAVSFAPANLIVRTTVVADANNRAMEVSAESEEFYRASEVQLDGERAPRITTFEFRSLPSGIYEVKATLFSGDGHARALVRQSVNVISSAGGR